MKCPECVDLNIKSKVFELNSTSTLSYNQPFFDEDGNRHTHDSNITTTEYECSNHHRISTTHRNKCWCGWPDKKE